MDSHLHHYKNLKIPQSLVLCTSPRIVSYNAAKFSEFRNLFYFVHPSGSPSVPLRYPQISQTSCSMYIPSDPQLQCCEIFKTQKPLLVYSSIWIPICTSAMSSNLQTSCSLYIRSDPQLHDCKNIQIRKALVAGTSSHEIQYHMQ